MKRIGTLLYFMYYLATILPYSMAHRFSYIVLNRVWVVTHLTSKPGLRSKIVTFEIRTKIRFLIMT